MAKMVRVAPMGLAEITGTHNNALEPASSSFSLPARGSTQCSTDPLLSEETDPRDSAVGCPSILHAEQSKSW